MKYRVLLAIFPNIVCQYGGQFLPCLFWHSIYELPKTNKISHFNEWSYVVITKEEVLKITRKEI